MPTYEESGTDINDVRIKLRKKPALCAEHLNKDNPDHIIFISYFKTPAEIRGFHETQIASEQGEVTTLIVRQETDSADSVDPTDLTSLGIEVTNRINTLTGYDHIRVCFDSITALLQYADTQMILRFLDKLTNKLTGQSVPSHFHFDPRVADTQTTAQMKSVFDKCVE